MKEDDLIKILLMSVDDVETLWAHPLGGALFQLDSIPFYAYSW